MYTQTLIPAPCAQARRSQTLFHADETMTGGPRPSARPADPDDEVISASRRPTRPAPSPRRTGPSDGGTASTAAHPPPSVAPHDAVTFWHITASMRPGWRPRGHDADGGHRAGGRPAVLDQENVILLDRKTRPWKIGQALPRRVRTAARTTGRAAVEFPGHRLIWDEVDGPSTSLSLLWTIARERPDLRRWLIVNPSSPPELLEYIAQQEARASDRACECCSPRSTRSASTRAGGDAGDAGGRFDGS